MSEHESRKPHFGFAGGAFAFRRTHQKVAQTFLSAVSRAFQPADVGRLTTPRRFARAAGKNVRTAPRCRGGRATGVESSQLADARGLVLLLLLLAFTITPPQLRAADLSGGFEAANKLYEQGKFVEAAGAYDKLIATGDVSDALYFNRGNALFKMGQTGRAIASYRQAQRLSPRDADVRTNLQLARTKARGGSPYPVNRWAVWLEKLSLNEWTLLTAAAVWLLFILLALGQWRQALQSRLRSYLLGAGAAVVLLGASLAIRIDNDLLATSAVVVVGEADVRNGPLDESQSIFKVRDGIELEVVDQKDGWLQVVDSGQRTGWLRQEQVIFLNASPKRTVGTS
jgi:tetratricopeptide (TPR) repeat protein